ncbi:MAG TPA: serine/threonine-protein kinase, partial [Kofleriaceae bacterium]
MVYRALDRERGVQVALKTLRGATPDSVLRFKTEFRSLRDIRQPNLVELGELFESEGQWFFTMELIRGAPLLAWVRGLVESGGPPSTDSAILRMGEISDEMATVVTPGEERTIATMSGESEKEPAIRPGPRADESRLRTALAGLTSGLAALHRAGKIHRDVKPSNVVVDETGRAVLLDFGVVAERQGSTADDKLIVGTVSYMAPEQARGDSVGPAADWYAMGVVLFQALTGRLPLAATSEALLVLKQHTPSPEVSRFVDAPEDLARLCMQLLEREPNERPSEGQIFELLGSARTVYEASWMPAATEGRLFVGRRVELGLLEAALAASQNAAVAVVVEGESGVGK